MQIFSRSASIAEVVKFAAGGAILGIVLSGLLLEPLLGPAGLADQLIAAAAGAVIVTYLRFSILAS